MSFETVFEVTVEVLRRAASFDNEFNYCKNQ